MKMKNKKLEKTTRMVFHSCVWAQLINKTVHIANNWHTFINGKLSRTDIHSQIFSYSICLCCHFILFRFVLCNHSISFIGEFLNQIQSSYRIWYQINSKWDMANLFLFLAALRLCTWQLKNNGFFPATFDSVFTSLKNMI